MKRKFAKFKSIFVEITAFFVIFCCLFAYFSPFSAKNDKNETNAAENKLVYAKAKENCILYKSSNLENNLTNEYFDIPLSYFVTILATVSDTVYKVSYKEFVGYCSADNLTIVSFTPSTSTLENITFDICSDAGTQIWSLPSDQSGNKLTTVPADTLCLEYIASITGEIPSGGTTNLWYYARYTPASFSTKVYEGYIYSEAATNLTHIPTNLEQENEEVTAPPIDGTITLNTTLRIILLCLICLPFLILFIITVIKSRRSFAHKKQAKQQESKASAKVVTLPQTSAKKPNLDSLAKRQFVKKPKPTEPVMDDDSIEIVFPDYSFVDDDDLL